MTEMTVPPAVRTGTPKLAAALAKAQGAFSPIVKNRAVTIYSAKNNSSYTFRYADLEELLNATRPALAANGLAIVQEIVNGLLRTVLMHESGEERVSDLQLGSSGSDDIKTFGAKISYLRRYAYQSMLCLAADDDLDEDGAEAGPVSTKAPGRAPVQKPQPARAEKPAASAGDQQPEAGGKPISDSQLKLIRAKCAAAHLEESVLCTQLGVSSVEAIPAAKVNDALDKIKGFAAAGGQA